MAGPNEPSMEDILASIKKVIAEDAPPRVPQERKVAPIAQDLDEVEESEDVLDLDASNVADAEPGTGHMPDTPPAAVASLMADEVTSSTRSRLEELADVAANAPASASVNPLEEMVREMLRPMLKSWLDERLPGIVDEHVRNEISRITGRKL
ncbi:DUF2497 domain-containing protein [Sphingomicrobium sp. XHP0235]|uniref:DUF2497 domain-containing protein n=1 Tax=Sphingomicrobium aquimarinum TaxID=3133971 RepID=UPI0031FF2055